MLKKKLQKALKAAGLSEGLADVINITSEDQIQTIVDQLKSGTTSDDDPEIDFEDVLKSEGFEEFVKTNGFDKVLELSKTLQSQHDRKVTTGIKNGLENFLKKKGGNSNPKEDDDELDSGLGDDAPEWAKTLLKKVNGLEQNNSKSKFSDNVKEALKKSNLPDLLKESWVNRIVDGEVPIEKQLEALEKEHEEIQKSIIGDNAGGGLPSGNKFSTETEKLKEIDKMGKDFVATRLNKS